MEGKKRHTSSSSSSYSSYSSFFDEKGREDLNPCLRALLGPALRHLSLAHNPAVAATPAAAAALGRLLNDFPSLESVNLIGCGRGEGGREGGMEIGMILGEVKRPLALASLLVKECGLTSSSMASLLSAASSEKLPRLATLEIDGEGGEECSEMLSVLLERLEGGREGGRGGGGLPGLAALTFPCLKVGDEEAWRQSEKARRIERVRPWLKAFVSWPVDEKGGGGEEKKKGGEEEMMEEEEREEVEEGD